MSHALSGTIEESKAGRHFLANADVTIIDSSFFINQALKFQVVEAANQLKLALIWMIFTKNRRSKRKSELYIGVLTLRTWLRVQELNGDWLNQVVPSLLIFAES